MVDLLQTFLTEAGKHKVLTREEEQVLTRMIREGGPARAQEARRQMVLCNLRLVVAIAKQEQRKKFHDTPLLDLIQDGMTGLITAVEKFDPDRGFKFSTYSSWWIRQSIIRWTQKDANIRLPAGRHGEKSKLSYAYRVLEQRLGRRPTEDDLVDYLDWPREKIRMLSSVLSDGVSLEDTIGGSSSNLTMGEILIDESDTPPDEVVEDVMVFEHLAEIMKDTLSEREIMVLVKRYGLDHQGQNTLTAISEMMPVKVTRERVRQIEKVAQRKLKQRLHKKDVI